MTRKLLFSIVFLNMITVTVFCQTKSTFESIAGHDSASIKMRYKSDVTIEIGGSGLYGSINYEHLIFYKPNRKVLFRTGLSYFPFNNYNGNEITSFAIIPIGIYNLTGNKHHLELGLNNTFGYAFAEKEFMYALNPSIGYRYQKFFSKSVTFSAAYAPLIGFIRSNGTNVWTFLPWVKFGIGYNFNRKAINTNPKSNLSDTINNRKKVFIELGAHIAIADRNCISKENVDGRYRNIVFPIDTSVLYVNSLVVNKRFFPTLATGINLPNHEFKVEFSYIKNKSSYSYAEDFGKYAYFNSQACYFLLGYCHMGFKIKKRKLNPNTRFYIGANLSYQYNDREFYYSHYNNIGGGYGSSEDLYSYLTSNHVSLLPDAGIKFGCNNRVYLKIGLRFNSLSYVFGKSSWNYKTITDEFPQITTYTENSSNLSKLLIAGESSYFMIVDNVYFKLGFSF